MRTRAPCGQPSKTQQDLEGQPPGSPPPPPGPQARLTLWVSMRALASARFHSSEGEPHSPRTSPTKGVTTLILSYEIIERYRGGTLVTI